MYKKLACILALSSSLFLIEKSFAEPSSNNPGKPIDIDAVVNKALETFQVPGAAVGIVIDGKVVLTKGFGQRNVEKALPVTENTLFAIGSCTKAFTTFVASQLVEEGKLSWDDPVVKYLPNFSLFNKDISYRVTVRDVAAHRTGLPRHEMVWESDEGDLIRKDILKRVPFLQLSCDVRERYQYNNLMYVVLGLIIEKITHKTWEENVKERILSPLGMPQTNFSVTDSQKQPDYSLPYATDKGVVVAIPFHKTKAMGPAGAINSSVAEMTKWLELQLSDGTLFNTHFLQTKNLQELHTIQTPFSTYPDGSTMNFGYALGWATGIYKGKYLVWHDGSIDGFESFIGLLPQEKIGVVVLTNNQDGGEALASSVTMTIFDLLLGNASEDWIAKMQKQLPNNTQVIHEPNEEKVSVDEYLGVYENPGYGTVTFSKKDGKLMANFNRLTIPLFHTCYDNFAGHPQLRALKDVTLPFSFFRNIFRDVIEVRTPLEPAVDPIVFKKMPPKELITNEYLSQFTGTYACPLFSLTMTLNNGHLMSSTGESAPAELIPLKPYVFALQGDGMHRLTSKPDSQGFLQETLVEGPEGAYQLQKR